MAPADGYGRGWTFRTGRVTTSAHGQAPWYRPESTTGRRTPSTRPVYRNAAVGMAPYGQPSEGGAVPQSSDDRLVGLAARLEHEDPRFARSLSTGQPTRPREYRRTGAWWALLIAVAMLIAGGTVPDGLLIAAGLVLSGIAVQLLDPERRSRPPRPPRRC